MSHDPYAKLEVSGWRQFENISVDLHPKLTVLTGANGAGKSTLLGLLSRNLGFSRNFLATPIHLKDGTLSYYAGIAQRVKAELPDQNNKQIGIITFESGKRCFLQVHGEGGGANYEVQMFENQEVKGLHIDSHRSTPTYEVVSQLPTQGIDASRAFDRYNHGMLTSFRGERNHDHGGMFRLKEALISMAIFGEGNQYVRRSPKLLELFVGFTEKLQEILPPEIGFKKISVRTPEVVLETASGDFMVDAASGGLNALIDVAWRIYMFSQLQPRFVVTMDEPENHLHPSMQRSLLPNLIAAFPQVQFIVATHSPFVVSSVRDSNVYVLRHLAASDVGAASRRVSSTKLDNINKAGTAAEILREVLGVPTTMAQWVQSDLTSIIERYRSQQLSAEVLGALRSELRDLGMDEFFPEALRSLVGSS